MVPRGLLTTRLSAVSSGSRSKPRRLAVKCLMRSGLVIERPVTVQALVRGLDGLVGVQVHLLVFEASPEAFHEYVISPAPFPVHADLDAVMRQESREFLAGELAALIGLG